MLLYHHARSGWAWILHAAGGAKMLSFLSVFIPEHQSLRERLCPEDVGN